MSAEPLDDATSVHEFFWFWYEWVRSPARRRQIDVLTGLPESAWKILYKLRSSGPLSVTRAKPCSPTSRPCARPKYDSPSTSAANSAVKANSQRVSSARRYSSRATMLTRCQRVLADDIITAEFIGAPRAGESP